MGPPPLASVYIFDLSQEVVDRQAERFIEYALMHRDDRFSLMETMSRKKISLCREFTFSDKKERSGIEVKRLVKTGFALGLFNDYLLNKEIKERWFFLSTRSLAIVASERIARLIAMKEYDKLSDEIIRQTLEGAEGKEDVGVFRYEDFKDFIY